MTKANRWWCVSAAVMGMMLLFLAGSNRAQEKKAPGRHDGMALSDSLRDVINVGAKMFNDQGDHVGCYRLYQGSLLSVRPFVTPELQKRIDDGIGNAEKMGSYADRAFELRRVLDEIRSSVRTAVKTGDKKDEVKDKKKEDVKDKKDVVKDKKDVVKDKKDVVKDKKDLVKDKKDLVKDKKDLVKDKKKDDDKNKNIEPAGEKGQVSGTITYEGKPLAGGYSVTLLGKGKKKYAGTIKDGTFKLAAPIPTGEYRVVIEPTAGENPKIVLPPRYLEEEMSSITVSVQAGMNNVNLNLVK